MFIINLSNYTLVLKIHKVLFCQNHTLWPIFDKVLMLLKQREIVNLGLYFFNLYYNWRFYFISESWFHILCVFCRSDWSVFVSSTYKYLILSAFTERFSVKALKIRYLYVDDTNTLLWKIQNKIKEQIK